MKLVRDFAENNDIDPALLLALCEIESGFDSYAVRVESDYRWLVKDERRLKELMPRNCTKETEFSLQRHSWGLTQIMGATARDMGFEGWLTHLVDPVINLSWATIRIKGLLLTYKNPAPVFAAWNAGSPRMTEGDSGELEYVNQEYVDKALQAYQRHGGIL